MVVVMVVIFFRSRMPGQFLHIEMPLMCSEAPRVCGLLVKHQAVYWTNLSHWMTALCTGSFSARDCHRRASYNMDQWCAAAPALPDEESILACLHRMWRPLTSWEVFPI